METRGCRAIKASKEGYRIISSSQVNSKTRKSMGAIHVVERLAGRLKITSALGKTDNTPKILLMMAARLIYPSSKLANVGWAEKQEVEKVFGIDSSKLDENDLYKALDWLDENQKEIEKKLFKKRYPGGVASDMLLYDVTSSYLEGQENQLQAWGYNRDGKKNKSQIVIGLMCDCEGYPIAVRVFKGNTGDTATIPEQIKVVGEQFGISRVTFVGDKGMLRGPQIKQLNEEGFNYISSISKAEIRTLLTEGVIQLDLFDDEIVELDDSQKGVRYILRRNSTRMKQIRKNRNEKMVKIANFVEEKNEYLAGSNRRSEEVALRNVNEKIARYKLKSILSASVEDRKIQLFTDENAILKAEELDGCYLIITDLPREAIEALQVHDRYKDLAKVEKAFRRMKSELEIRPLYHRLATRTRAHVFICMLAYMIEVEFERLTKDLKGTFNDKWYQLDHLMTSIITIDKTRLVKCNDPTDEVAEILKALHIAPPKLNILLDDNL